MSDPQFDVELDTYREGETEPRRRWLSTLSGYEVREQLDAVVRDPQVIELGVRKMITGLEEMRRANPGTARAAAIVYSVNDRPSERNAHANRIRDEIRQQAPALKTLIVTMAMDDDFDTDAVAQLREFSRETSEWDVLIVKQMGAIGLNTPRLKVGLDLSAQRAKGPYIQRANRTTRPWAGVYHAIYITPDDCLAKALFEELIEAHGGAYVRTAEVVDSYEIPVDETPHEITEIVATQDSIVSDTSRNSIRSPRWCWRCGCSRRCRG